MLGGVLPVPWGTSQPPRRGGLPTIQVADALPKALPALPAAPIAAPAVESDEAEAESEGLLAADPVVTAPEHTPPPKKTASQSVLNMLDLLSERKAAKKDVAAADHIENTGKAGKLHGKTKGRGKGRGKANVVPDIGPPDRTVKAGVTKKHPAKGKAKGKAVAKAESKGTKKKELVLGCSKCRWAKIGCGRCRDSGFTGFRWTSGI